MGSIPHTTSLRDVGMAALLLCYALHGVRDTSTLLCHVSEGGSRAGYQCGGRYLTSACHTSVQRWWTAGDEQLACPGASHYQRWGAGPWLYCRAQTRVG